MAHFARVDENNTVKEIIVIANDAILDDNGDESEALGQALIESIGLTGTWLQCSYNGTLRGRFPGSGYTYDVELDEFLPPKPVGDYVWDENQKVWESVVEPAE